MFSPQRNSGKESKKESSNLNLSVRGCSAPIHTSQLKTLREYKTQRFIPQERKSKEFPFPVEKIVYLSERLELTSLTEKKIKSVSLSAVDIKGRNSSREVLPSRGHEGPSAEVCLPGFDFSLDLSSISNNGDDSDESCEEFMRETSLHYNSESTSTLPSCETSRVANCSNRKESRSGTLFFHGTPKPRTCDLINIYVNSGNNRKDLVKYFRPCRTCQELCCICPDLPSVSGRVARSEVCCFQEADKSKINKAVETDISVTEFACNSASCPASRETFRESDCCCCSNYLEDDFFQSLCGAECRCRSDEVFSASNDFFASSGSKTVSYTSSLANAARSARVLARDLEIILSTLSSGTE